MGDARIEIEEILADPSGVLPLPEDPSRPMSWRWMVPWVAAHAEGFPERGDRARLGEGGTLLPQREPDDGGACGDEDNLSGGDGPGSIRGLLPTYSSILSRQLRCDTRRPKVPHGPAKGIATRSTSGGPELVRRTQAAGTDGQVDRSLSILLRARLGPGAPLCEEWAIYWKVSACSERSRVPVSDLGFPLPTAPQFLVPEFPGKPKESRLYDMVHRGSMPPDENTRLADRDIATIREWIEAGAASSNRQVASISASAAGYDDVIPVMLMHCTVCHGLRRQEGGLDLSTRVTSGKPTTRRPIPSSLTGWLGVLWTRGGASRRCIG